MDLDDAQLLATFEAAGFGEDDFTHARHIRIAWILLDRNDRDLDATVDALRVGLRAQLAALGVTESLARGFHETVTRAWAHVVLSTMNHHGAAEDSAAFLELHPHLGASRLLRLFYSRDRILTAEAKAGWVEPDLTALPAL